MEIKKVEKDSEIEFHIFGHIENFQDITAIKSALKNRTILHSFEKVVIVVFDAISLPSSVIGTLLELIEILSLKVEVHVVQEELYKSLKRLTLIDILSVKMRNI